MSEAALTTAETCYRQLASIPSYSSATVRTKGDSNGFVVSVFLSQRDYVRNAKRTLQRQVAVVDLGTAQHVIPTQALDLGEVALQKVSPSGKFLAVLRTATEKGTTSAKRYVEVWSDSSLKLSLDVTEKHGDFYTDDTFGTLAWSPKEGKLLYVAECKKSEDPHEKFNFTPDWGERFTKKARPSIVIVDLNGAFKEALFEKGKKPQDHHVQVLQQFPDISPGQAVFAEEETLVFTAYTSYPRKYGIVFCSNRLSGIYRLSGPNYDTPERLTEHTRNARSPRLSPDGNSVLYLSNPVGGAHNACGTLERIALSDTKNNADVVVDMVQAPSAKDHFPGLFVGQLPSNAFVGDWILMDSIWGSRKKIVAVNLRTQKVVKVEPVSNESMSSGVLFASDKYVIAVSSSPVSLPILHLGVVKSGQDDEALDISWTILDKTEVEDEVQNMLDCIDYEILQDIHPTSKYLEAIHIFPKNNPKGRPPLINFPHGGPHSSFTTEFSAYSAAFAVLGFAVAEVNYTGSLGFGQDNVEALVGKCGELEVEDTHFVAEYLVKQNKVDKDHISLFGGSHGGFTSAHLIGKYPDYYKACVLRNPVINIGNMVATTDIPDWCYAELGLDYSFQQPPVLKPEEYEAMYARSPIRNAEKIKTPILLLIGEGDRRVPPSEGYTFYYILKGQGKQVELLAFPEIGHSLDSMDAEVYGWDKFITFL